MANRQTMYLSAQQKPPAERLLCECCGQLRPEVIHTDLNAQTVSRGALIVKVRPTGAELMAILLRFLPGKLVPYERIYSGLWGANYADRGRRDQNSISVQLLHLRRAIEPLGLEIIVVRGLGLRLDIKGGKDGS